MLKAWTREALTDFVQSKLHDYRLIVVSNREPFQHIHKGGEVECIQPAGGMVSALDPVMRASGALWIAHGSGSADRDTVDYFDHVRVPPDNPQYTLRRVWLSAKEQQGHYDGLSNQGLWPLCHVAFARPTFNPADWEMYRQVNERFAEAVLEEAGDEPTFVFIQDYHFALLPRMLRNARSNLVIAQFWHIPWPNAEVFHSFPWREEILDGMLGNDLLGFHLPNHCHNFLDTVDCSVEARVDRANSEIALGGHSTMVRPFPIGIDYDQHVETAGSYEVAARSIQWEKELALNGRTLGIGIDRLDYTKGIPERLRAFDLFLERNPRYRGEVVFAQIAVPSRSTLPAYRQIEEEVEGLVRDINARWGTSDWQPVLLFKRHFSPPEMIALHRLAQFCVVTALHDGMNLVAKEYVASCVDETGVLILSQFAGAARELKDALLINPFSIEECAEALAAAIEMHPDEQQRRMRKMRETVGHNNVYRWAGKFLADLCRIEFPEYPLAAQREFRTVRSSSKLQAMGRDTHFETRRPAPYARFAGRTSEGVAV